MKRYERPGFVTTLAVMMIGLVAVALAALTTRVGTAARQAAAAREQAQVEQLLLAGIEIARQGAGERPITLPTALADEGAKLKLSVRGKRVEIEAQVGRSHAREESGAGVAPGR
jgi:type II secretory pathway component PulK